MFGAAGHGRARAISMQVKANGIAFNCQIDGARGAPWLIFSNSLATNLSMWDHQAQVLSTRFQILRYDQRGHGKTDAPEGRYAFATLLTDVIALMDALKIPSARFCGLSLGGATALGLAEQHPDRIDRAIVCDSPCASTPASAKQWEERIAVAKARGMDALVEPTLQRWFNPAAFKLPAQYTFGNAARNLLFGPGQWKLDVGLHKNFRLSEHGNLQFRAEAFNMPNHPSFGNPSASLSSPSTIGRISATSVDQRAVQFAVRVSF